MANDQALAHQPLVHLRPSGAVPEAVCEAGSVDPPVCHRSPDLFGKHLSIVRTQAVLPDDEHRRAANVAHPVRSAVTVAQPVLTNDCDVHGNIHPYQRIVLAQQGRC